MMVLPIETIVRNLKLFNAKERDHLMRFAYLGENTAYDAPQSEELPRCFLDKAFDHQLKVVSGVDSEATCVFAGMDYHLDWLFVALWLSSSHPDRAPAAQDLPPIEMDDKHCRPGNRRSLHRLPTGDGESGRCRSSRGVSQGQC